MGFAASVSFFDPTSASDPQDGNLQQALGQALAAWSQYISGVGTLDVQLNVKSLDSSTLADGGPTRAKITGQTLNGNQIVELSSSNSLETGNHIASNDISLDFNSSYLSAYASTDSNYLVATFEHELLHGFGVIGYRDSTGQLSGYETVFDSLSQFNATGQDFFTGANAVAAYGGPIPLTTSLGASNYYHLGATGTASDPVSLQNDILSPYGSDGPISGLDVAILKDLGIPLTAAGQTLIASYISANQTIIDAVTGVFTAVLGRSITAGELSGAEQQLASGASIADIRTYLATTGEAANAINYIFLSVLGRAPAASDYAGLEQALASGATLTDLRNYFSTTAEAGNAIASMFDTVLGRAPAAGEVASLEASLADGASLSGIRGYFSTTQEAANAITAVFNADLGRAPTAADLSGLEQALANGASIANLRSYFAATTESANAINAVFQATVGRAPNVGDVPSIQADFARGWSVSGLRTVLATSAEEGTAIARAYQNDLGRPATPSDVAAVEQNLVGGSTLQALQSTLVGSAEFAGDISATFQAVLGRPANAVEIAADGSQILSSYSTLATIEAQLGELSGGQPPPGSGAVIGITPQTISGGGPNLVYGILNNDAVISANPLAVADQAFGALSSPTITGFNPATDVIQIQHSQVSSFAALGLAPITNGTSVYVGNGGFIDLNGTAQASLSAANFRFV